MFYNHHDMRKMEKFFIKAVAVLTGLVALGWKWLSMPYDDDFSYMRTVVQGNEPVFWDGAGSVISSWGDALSTLWPHYTTINGRLSNLLMFLTVPMPHWLVAFIQALVAAASVWAVLRICSNAAESTVKPWLAAIIAAAFWFWFPWNDNMVSTDYYLNYALPAATMLIYGHLLTNGRKSHMVLLTVMGFLTGWLHEAFGLSALSGTVVWLAVASKGERRRVFAALEAVAAGCAVSVLAPSTLARIDNFPIDDTIHHTFHYLLASKPLYITLLLTVVAAVCRRFTPRTSGILGFWATAALASFAIGWHFRGTAHYFWPMFTALYAYCAVLLALIFVKSKPLMPLALSVTLCYALWGVGLAVQSARAGAVNSVVLSQLEAGEKTVYVPHHGPQPKWVRGMTPTYDENWREKHYLGLRYIEGGWDSVPRLIPVDQPGRTSSDLRE